MTNVVALNAENTKPAAGKSFTGNANRSPILLRLADAIRVCWPRKTAQCVSHLTNTDERTVKFWLAGETRMSVESVGALLRSSEGFAILTAIMGDAKPKWWLAAQSAQEIRTSRIAVKREQERIDRARAQLSLLDE